MRALAARLGIAERVHFAGGQENVRPWYGLADAFVLATLYDPLPNAVLEALACGLPAVVTAQCGASELVRPGASGEVCDVFDAPSIVRAMRAVSAGDRSGRREAARASVSHLGLAAMGDKMGRLYEALLQGRSGGGGV